jgi:molecular chaperone DnaK (HSP70)
MSINAAKKLLSFIKNSEEAISLRGELEEALEEASATLDEDKLDEVEMMIEHHEEIIRERDEEREGVRRY